MGIRKYYWKIRDFIADANKKPYSVIASRNGQLFEIKDLFIGRLISPVRDIHELDEIKSSFEFKLPKIPGYLLEQVISFFRDYCDRYETEVMVHVYFDTELEVFTLECPIQEVSKAEVNYKTEDLNPRRYTKIMDIHSHNSMTAHFSPTDNVDETTPLLFGVVGRLDREPQMIFRVGVSGYYQELPATHLFSEFDVNNHVAYPAEWEAKVTVKEG